MCLECGHYKGRMVVDMAAKKKAREERLQAKREMIQAQQGDMGENELAQPTPEAAADAVEPEVKEKQK